MEQFFNFKLFQERLTYSKCKKENEDLQKNREKETGRKTAEAEIEQTTARIRNTLWSSCFIFPLLSVAFSETLWL